MEENVAEIAFISIFSAGEWCERATKTPAARSVLAIRMRRQLEKFANWKTRQRFFSKAKVVISQKVRSGADLGKKIISLDSSYREK